MQSPVQMTSILLAYVFFSVYVGPRLMANRKPFRLNTAMIIYNLSMVLFNAYIVYEVDKSAWQIVLGFFFLFAFVGWVWRVCVGGGGEMYGAPGRASQGQIRFFFIYSAHSYATLRQSSFF